jgi:hypothetical protein
MKGSLVCHILCMIAYCRKAPFPERSYQASAPNLGCWFDLTHRIAERERRLAILYQKQGRSMQFASKAERDKALQKEITDLQKTIEQRKKQVRSAQVWGGFLCEEFCYREPRMSVTEYVRCIL